jgi:hypothetical protein
VPRYILLDFDPWWFRQGATVEASSGLEEPYSSREIVDFAWRRGFWWSLEQLSSRSVAGGGFLGAQAITQHQGVRPDGSFFLPAGFRPKKEGAVLREELEQRVRDGIWPWVHDSENLSISAVHELRRFLDFCEARGIRVVGFMSVFRPEYYSAVQQERGLRYIWKVKPALEPVFEQAHSSFLDYLDPSSIGCPEQEFVDPLHESEVCAIRMLIKMAEQSEVVASVVDAGKLKAMLRNRTSDWQLGF